MCVEGLSWRCKGLASLLAKKRMMKLEPGDKTFDTTCQCGQVQQLPALDGLRLRTRAGQADDWLRRHQFGPQSRNCLLFSPCLMDQLSLEHPDQISGSRLSMRFTRELNANDGICLCPCILQLPFLSGWETRFGQVGLRHSKSSLR